MSRWCLLATLTLVACGGSTSDDDGTSPAPPSDDLLSGAGLYADIARRTLASGVEPYQPRFELWSDATTKRRWIKLPPGADIDTSDMDYWRLPVGTKLFKEFALDGTLLETRSLERTPEGYEFRTYVWRRDGTDAVRTSTGAVNVNGTQHDVPEEQKCLDCHEGEPGRALGFSAVQLAGATPLALADLSDRMSHAPPDYQVPGSSSVAAALGYLHANCGSCHNENGPALEDTDLVTRLRVSERTPESTQIYLTSVGRRLQSWRTFDYSMRVVANDPDQSGLLVRMQVRNDEQMPPFATKHPDEAGIELVKTWIENL